VCLFTIFAGRKTADIDHYRVNHSGEQFRQANGFDNIELKYLPIFAHVEIEFC
jgi:hypothetical protein